MKAVVCWIEAVCGWLVVDVERLRRELIKFEFDEFNFLIVMQINDRSSL